MSPPPTERDPRRSGPQPGAASGPTRPGRCPLPGNPRGVLASARAPNLGLYFDKFFDGWSAGANSWSIPTGEKQRFLGEVASLASAPDAALAKRLEEHRHRIERLVVAERGRLGLFRADERLVTGTGRAHPTENGFSWHHSLGVPYVPGTSLKGVVRSWAEETGRPVDDLGDQAHVGSVGALDALPDRPVPLVVEVLTPHSANWSSAGPPGDWRSPVPIPYLAVEEGATFLVAALPRRDDSGALERYWALLVEALEFSGLGARSSIGFGRLTLVEELGAPPSLDTAEPAEPVNDPPGPTERWEQEFQGRGDQEIYERARRGLEDVGSDPEGGRALRRALEASGHLPAWRLGRARGNETTGSKKLRELAARLDTLHGEVGEGTEHAD